MGFTTSKKAKFMKHHESVMMVLQILLMMKIVALQFNGNSKQLPYRQENGVGFPIFMNYDFIYNS